MWASLRSASTIRIVTRSYRSTQKTHTRQLCDTKKTLPTSERTLRKYANVRKETMFMASLVVVGWPALYFLSD